MPGIVTVTGKPWKAIVFDFDGTLAKLNIDFTAMRSDVLEVISAYRIPAEGIRKLHILEMIDAAGAHLAAERPEAALPFRCAAHALVTAREMTAADQGELFDTTRMLLFELRRRSIRTGIVTRNCRAALLRLFPDIDHYCQTVLTREDAIHVKPHPDHLKAVLAALDAAPADAAMVGDHPLDMQLGRETGAAAIGVLTGHSTEEELRRAGADLIIPKAVHLLDILPGYPDDHRDDSRFSS
ncbi:MAG: HAD family hydrolase [Syntrophales bacterium]